MCLRLKPNTLPGRVIPPEAQTLPRSAIRVWGPDHKLLTRACEERYIRLTRETIYSASESHDATSPLVDFLLYTYRWKW